MQQAAHGGAQHCAHDEKGKFIPVRKTDILDALVEHGTLARRPASARNSGKSASLLAAVYHYEYFERLEKLQARLFLFQSRT